MNYKYRKSALFFQWVVIALVYAFFVILAHYITDNEQFHKKIIWGGAGFCIFMIIAYSKEFINRCVELNDNVIIFNSFRFKDMRIKNAVSFKLKYEDIFSINIRKLPLIGIWAIVVCGKNLPNKITISFCFYNYINLYDELCNRVRISNPNVCIDQQLLNYIERRKNEKKK